MTETFLSDADLGIASTPSTPSSDVMSDSDLGINSSGDTASGGTTAPSAGEAYRPGPGFSYAGDLWNDITGQKPQGVIGTRPGQVSNTDTRNPFVAAVEDIPSEVGSAASSAWQGVSNLNPVSSERQTANAAAGRDPNNPVGSVKDISGFFGGMGQEANQTLGTGADLMSILSLPLSLPVGINRSVTGHLLAGSGLAQDYQQGKDEADLLLSAIAPSRGRVAVGAFNTPKGSSFSSGNPPVGNIPKSPLVPVPGTPVSPVGPFGVVQTAGEQSEDIGTLQAEQAARQGDSGALAQKKAQEFDQARPAQIQSATSQVQSALNISGTPIDAAQEAGNLISQSLQKVAKASKDNVDAKYNTARAGEGSFNTEDFDGEENPTVAQSVRSSVLNGPGNIILDPSPGGLTPGANAALGYLRDIPELQPDIEPPSEGSPEDTEPTVVHKDVPLQTLDQIRRNLVAYRDASWSNSPTDGRAASAIVDAFDNHFADLADNGGFTGPQESLDNWNDARAANAAHQETFGVGKSDPVGQSIQQVLGTQNRIPLTGNDVADRLYGASGANPTTSNIDLVQHLQGIFGADSPEMDAIRQGQFARLTDNPSWGHKRVSENIDKFLQRDGKEMADTQFSPAQKGMIQSYGDMRKSLIPKEGTRNPSGTSPFVNRAINAVVGLVGQGIGMVLGHHFLGSLPEPAPELVGGTAAKGVSKISDIIQARKISNQMPTTARAIKQWETSAARAANNYSPQTRRALIHTSGRLSNALAPFGVSLKSVLSGLQGPGVGYANPQGPQNQGNVPGPENQQNNTGDPGHQQGFAKGGRIKQKQKPLKIIKHGYRLKKSK